MKNFKIGFKSIGIVAAVIVVFSACAEGSKNKTITIATAANMQFAMQKIADKYAEQTGIACELVVASSGKLTAQIQEGAPYDVFVAANTKYPKAVYDAGLSDTEPQVYAYGKLVMWTIDSTLQPAFELLRNQQINHIAVANPKTAPYGEAAISALQQKGIYTAVASKLVYGESISQTNQFIISGAAEIGFTALAVVKASEIGTRGSWVLVEDSLYRPIEQATVLIKREGGEKDAAKAFYEYIFTEEAQKILLEYGYSVDE